MITALSAAIGSAAIGLDGIGAMEDITGGGGGGGTSLILLATANNFDGGFHNE